VEVVTTNQVPPNSFSVTSDCTIGRGEGNHPFARAGKLQPYRNWPDRFHARGIRSLYDATYRIAGHKRQRTRTLSAVLPICSAALAAREAGHFFELAAPRASFKISFGQCRSFEKRTGIFFIAISKTVRRGMISHHNRPGSIAVKVCRRLHRVRERKYNKIPSPLFPANRHQVPHCLRRSPYWC
jgi:hypothetical protein